MRINLIALLFFSAACTRSEPIDTGLAGFQRELVRGTDYETATLHAEAIRRAGKRSRDRAMIARGLVRLAFAELYFGRWDHRWQRRLRRAQSLADECAEISTARAEALMFSGYLDATFLQKAAQGVEKLRRAVSLGRLLEDDRLLAHAHWFLARTLPFSDELGARRVLACHSLVRGAAFARNGAHTDLELACLRGLTRFGVELESAQRARLSILRAETGLDAVDISGPGQLAKAWTEVAERLAASADDELYGPRGAWCLDVAQRMLVQRERRGEWLGAECCLEAAEHLAGLLHDSMSLLWLRKHRAGVLARNGDSAAALEVLQPLLEHCAQSGDAASLPSLQRWMATQFQTGGDPALALSWYSAAPEPAETDDSREIAIGTSGRLVAAELDARRVRRALRNRERWLDWAYVSLPLLTLFGLSLWFWRRARDHGDARRRLQSLVDEQTDSLRAAKDRAERANAAKTEFLARVNHELRNPLTAIVGSCEVLGSDQPQPPEVLASARETVQSCTSNLMDVINEVLDFTQIESGEVRIESVEFELYGLIHAVRAIVRTQLAQGVAFVSELDPAMPAWVRGDKAKLKQVLLNVALNAARYTERGAVTIRCAALEGGVLEFQVEDSGVGMSAEELTHAFDPYLTDSDGHGTGLGLHISRTFVERMGGSMTLSSQPGVGTDCRIRLPLPAVATAPISAGLAGSASLQRPLRVLVVDDEPANRDVIGRMLESLGHHPAVAEYWVDVEARLCEGIDVILLDLAMPEMDGFEVASRAMQMGLEPAPLICAMTGDVTPSVRVQAESAGFAGFVLKPVTSKMLDSVIRSMLR